MIRTVIRYADDMVMVLDKSGKRMVEYHEWYHASKDTILKDAPPDARFFCISDSEPVLQRVSREEW